MKRTLFYPLLLLSMLLTSCELYMDELEVPETNDGANPTEEVVTENFDGAEISYKFTDSTVELTEQYDQYIVANVNDSILYYREDTPNAFLPKPGEILISRMREKYPAGLARKVCEVKKDNGMFTVTTERAYYTEVFSNLDLNLTNMDYPSVHYVNYEEDTAPIVSMPGKTRAAGDKMTVDGVTFTRVGTWEVNMNGSQTYNFSKKFSGTIDGGLTLTIEEYEAIIEDEIHILDGTLKKHGLSMIKYTLTGKAKMFGSIIWKPFEHLANATAATTTAEGAGLVGHVLYPDLTITLSAGMEFDGTYTETCVYETKCNVVEYGFSKNSGMKTVTNKYGAGKTCDVDINGFINLNINFQCRFGVGAIGGLIEAGAYLNLSGDFTITLDDDKNCHAIFVPYEENEYDVRAYEPRANDNLYFKIELTDVGQYYRIGVPYASRSAFSTLMQSFVNKSSFNFSMKDVVKTVLDVQNGEGILYLNHLELAKMVLKFKPWIDHRFLFYPELDTKNTYLTCVNDNDLNRNYDRIKGKVIFQDDGMFGYEGLELIIFDSDGNYQMRASCKDLGIIKEKNAYEFDVKIPRYSNFSGDWDYYNIYPCYKTHADDHSGINPSEKDWHFYCDRPIIVKNYRPCVNMTKTHQNAFYKEYDYDIAAHAYLYNIRTYAQIQTLPEVQDWGLMVFLWKSKVSINEANMKESNKVGDYMFQPNSDGDCVYMKDESVSSVDLEIRNNRKSIDGYWAYIVPFYKKVGQDTAVILYKDGVRVQLSDDETLNDRYEAEHAELADQILSPL